MSIDDHIIKAIANGDVGKIVEAVKQFWKSDIAKGTVTIHVKNEKCSYEEAEVTIENLDKSGSGKWPGDSDDIKIQIGNQITWNILSNGKACDDSIELNQRPTDGWF